MNFQEQAVHLFRNLDQRMSPSIYDVSWLLRLKNTDGSRFKPEYLGWLLERQFEDGSWGADIRYYHHDRVICTLSAAIALSEQPSTQEIRAAIKKAESFLWKHVHLLHRDPAFTELVGFELIFPSLMEDALQRGLSVPGHSLGMNVLKNEKLRLIPREMLFSRHLTTVHSLEFFGFGVPAKNLHSAVFDNGSLGNSPAATAYYLLACRYHDEQPNPGAMDYLERVLSRYSPTNYLFPFRNFETLWVLNNLLLNGGFDLYRSFLTEAMLNELEAAVETTGVSLDHEFGIADADCTAVAYYLLSLMGRSPDPVSLTRYEVPGQKFFRTYNFERNLSVSTNIHALDALRMLPQYPNRDRVIESITHLLFKSRRFNLFWTDKWHASPYYASGYAVRALLDGNEKSRLGCRDSIDWMAHAQRSDGSWGFFSKGTMEETAYAMLALQKAYEYDLVESDVLHRGAAYLAGELEVIDPRTDYQELWLGKCLYAPYDIVHSAVLSALIAHEMEFGRII